MNGTHFSEVYLHTQVEHYKKKASEAQHTIDRLRSWFDKLPIDDNGFLVSSFKVDLAESFIKALDGE